MKCTWLLSPYGDLRLKKNLVKIINCHKNNCGKWKIDVYLRISCVFWFGHFPRSRIKSKSSYFDKVQYNYCSNFFVERFVPKNGAKKLFPIVFKKWFFGGTVFFAEIFVCKKPNTPESAQVLAIMCPKLNSVTALLSPPYLGCLILFCLLK